MVSDTGHDFGANSAKGGTTDELSIATRLFPFGFAMMLQEGGSTESNDGAFCQMPFVVGAAAPRGVLSVIILVVTVVIALSLILRRRVLGPDLAPIVSLVIFVVVSSWPIELSRPPLIVIVLLWCLWSSGELPLIFTPWRRSSLLAISIAIAVAVSIDHLLFSWLSYDDRVGADDDWLGSIILCRSRISFQLARGRGFALPLPLPRRKPVAIRLALIVAGGCARGRRVVIELDDLVLCDRSMLWPTTADYRHVVPVRSWLKVQIRNGLSSVKR